MVSDHMLGHLSPSISLTFSGSINFSVCQEALVSCMSLFFKNDFNSACKSIFSNCRGSAASDIISSLLLPTKNVCQHLYSLCPVYQTGTVWTLVIGLSLALVFGISCLCHSIQQGCYIHSSLDFKKLISFANSSCNLVYHLTLHHPHSPMFVFFHAFYCACASLSLLFYIQEFVRFILRLTILSYYKA